MDFTLHELFADIGIEGQKKLCGKTVTLIGIGGIGSSVAEILARAGVNLRIIDKGRILEKDIMKQCLYRLEDISKFKAKQSKKILEEINSQLKVKTFHEDLHEGNIFLIESDLVVDLTNNMATSDLVNKHCLEKKIPLIFSNYAGSKGHVLIVDRSQYKGAGPCVNCIRDKLEFKDKINLGVYAPVTYLLAALVASAVIKNLLNYGNVAKLLNVDVMKTDIRHESVEKDKKCSVCSVL